jgi:hypothetical protein
MKTNIILIALFFAAFMFPSIGSVDTADAETDISHCANLEATAARPACEAAAHGKTAHDSLEDTSRREHGTAGSVRPTIMACSSDHKIFTSPAACDGVPIPITVDNLVPSSHIIDLSVYISPACAKKRIPRYGSKKDIIAAFKCNQITK